MFRKLSIFVSVLALASGIVSASGTANPDPTANGCFVNDTVAAVNEGMPIAVTVQCAGIPTDNNVFGFQFGTSVTSGSFVGTTPTVYTPGTFTSTATGGAAGTFVGENALALYGVSRKTTNVVGATDFTLGSLALTAVTNRGTGFTDGDGSVAVTLDDATFKLSDNFGASLPNWLRTVNDATTTVTDIDLAWLNGTATVQSDSAVIGHIKNVTLNLGSNPYTATTIATNYKSSLAMDPAYLYVEDASGVVGGSFATANPSDNVLDIGISADMWGHMACSTSVVDLGDVGAAEAVTGISGVGTAGTITLKAGDVDGLNGISNTDATIIGDEFGATGVSINALYEGDINLDGTVDILDLVHVGRNFGATATTC